MKSAFILGTNIPNGWSMRFIKKSKMPHYYESNGAFSLFFPGVGFSALYLYHAFSSGTCCHALCFLPPLPTLLSFLPYLVMLTSFMLTQLKSSLDSVPATIFRLNLYATISSLGQLTTLQLDSVISRRSGWEKTASPGRPLCALTIPQIISLTVHFPSALPHSSSIRILSKRFPPSPC